MYSTLKSEWRYTYRSARRDGFGRTVAFRRFLRELRKGWVMDLGLDSGYRRDGSERRVGGW
jgi:hypothetical protein